MKENKFKLAWVIWVLAINGELDINCFKKSEIIAYSLRTLFVLLNIVTCFFIMSNIIHHW